MAFVAFPENRTKRNSPGQLAKSVILLVLSLGLFAFAEEFFPANIFEPESMGWKLWFSYAKDLILPFAFYLFLCLGERWLRTWHSRAVIAFAIFAVLEFGQLLYYRVFSGRYVGSSDPLDIFMYAMSIGLAVLVEQRVLPKLFKFW